MHYFPKQYQGLRVRLEVHRCTKSVGEGGGGKTQISDGGQPGSLAMREGGSSVPGNSVRRE